MCDEVVSMPIADVPVSDVDLWSVTNLKEPHERFIADRASELVEEVMGRGSIDAVCELGEPFSTRVVGNLVGLPREGRDRRSIWRTRGSTYGVRPVSGWSEAGRGFDPCTTTVIASPTRTCSHPAGGAPRSSKPASEAMSNPRRGIG
jgi:hypothetical protein